MREFSLYLRGKVMTVTGPLVMGILNVTPDSFYSGSRALSLPEGGVKRMACELIAQGADIIDIGGCSTRPGSQPVSEAEETDRVMRGIEAVREISSDVIISVDTWRSEVARRAVAMERGADIVNDISAGMLDPEMIPAVAELKVPYIMMHTRGTPETMGSLTDYPGGVTATVAAELHERIAKATLAGIADIIVDPGFSFAKTVEQNYRLMEELPVLDTLLDHRPILVGISRKSMIYKPLALEAGDVLAATTALNTVALRKGAAILRVHDPFEARQAVEICRLLEKSTKTP